MKTPSMKHLLPALLLAVLVALVVVACGSDNGSSGGAYGGGGGGGASPTPTTTGSPATGAGGGPGVTVSIKDFAFSPAKLEIDAGTTVTWTNEDSAPHTVTSKEGDDLDAAVTDLFDSGDMQQGATFSYTFDEPGNYYYLCTLHASMQSMHAEVEVK
jgi:plastocyanin